MSRREEVSKSAREVREAAKVGEVTPIVPERNGDDRGASAGLSLGALAAAAGLDLEADANASAKRIQVAQAGSTSTSSDTAPAPGSGDSETSDQNSNGTPGLPAIGSGLPSTGLGSSGNGATNLSPMADESTRWGRDDLKRHEMGSQGDNLSTLVGSAIGHMVGLADEEPGRRNGEKITSTDNRRFQGEVNGVGQGIDHLWLLGDVEYTRASIDDPDYEIFEQRPDKTPGFGPLSHDAMSWKLLEDNALTGRIFDAGEAVMPVVQRSISVDPASGHVTFDADGTFTFTPVKDFSGIATVVFAFTDPRTGREEKGTITITVEAVADAPSISGGAATPEDVRIATPITVTLNDTDGSEVLEKVVISNVPSGAVLDWNKALPGSLVKASDGSFVVTGSTTEIQNLLQSLAVTPPKDFHGTIILGVAATTIEANVSPSLPGYRDRETLHFDYRIAVEAVADPVTATGDTKTTDEDVAVHLSNLAATFGDLLDGSEVHTIEIRGVDADAKLRTSAGVEYPYTTASDGTHTYKLTPAQVGNVYFLPPPDESGTFSGMTIAAIATEKSNGDKEIATAPIQVTVNPVADPLDITAPTQATNEDTAVTFGDDISIVVNDPATQTVTSVVVSGFPLGTTITYTPVGGGAPVTIVSGAGGSVTFTGGTEAQIRAALATLTLTPPQHTDQNITLSIAATTQDLGGVTDTRTIPMTITVAAVADGPTISGSAAGNEDQPIALPITLARIDVDGSEKHEFVEITVPAGVTLTYPATLPNGITVVVSGNTFTFSPGASTTNAQFENFLATGLQVQAPPDSDVNFDVSVRGGTIESVLSGGEVALLRKDLTVTVPVTVRPVVDMPTVTGSSTVDEDTTVNFGANIAITQNDKADGSEAFTSIVLGAIPAAATVNYTPQGGTTVTVSTVAGISTYTISGGTEDNIRATLATFTLRPPLHSDANIPVSVSITKVDRTTTEGEAAATSTATSTHNITVAAVADGPTISGSAAGNEDQPIALPITVSRIDADGSEQYDFAEITVPTGVTLIYPATLPNGITVAVAGSKFTFSPGVSTTAAQFEAFLAGGLQVRAPADSDVNFDVAVKVGTIESVLSDTGLTLLRADTTVQVPVAVSPVIDAPTITGSSTVNEDGIVAPSDQTVTAGVNFGANINITAPDSSDGSEAITRITVSGLPIGSVVTYTPIGGSSTTFTVAAGTTSLTLGGGGETEAQIRTALSTLTLVPPAHSDADIPLTITVIKSDATTTEAEGPATQTFTATHLITVAAIADVPTLTGSGAGLEDQNIPVSITVGHPDNADGTEKIKNVVISGVPAGFTLSESSPGLGVLTANGGGTYTVTGPDDAAINGVLANLSLVFAPGGARQHLDTDFSLSVTATTIESAPSETGVGQVAQLETSQTFSVPVTVTAVVDGVTKSGASVIVEDVAKTIGTDIQWTKIDADGSEHVTSVVISAIPAGAVVTYTDLLGAVQTFTSTGVETITLTGPHSAATETAIRAALDTLAVTAPANTDTNFTLNVVITTTDNDASATTQSFTQTVVVQAVADAPTVAADAITLNEDTTATLAIRPDRSIDNDNSETLSVRITVPSDGTGVVGTLSAGAAAGITFTNVGGGVYTVAASGATPALREATLDAFLNGGVTFTPRPQWSGVLTGTNGIKVEAISTEAATLYGNTTPSPDDELAPNNNATAGTSGDLDTKIEIATTYIDVTVAAINDTPVLANASSIYQENTNSSAIADPDLVIPLGTRLGLSIADTDGSQGLSMTLTGLPTNAQALAFGTSLAGVTTSVDIPTGTVTISGTNANNVLTVLASLSITLADDRDQNFTVAINGTSTDTNGVTPVNTAFSLSHQVTVQAVADTPTVDVGATTKAAVDEDSGFVTYPVTTALNDTDGSETYQSVLVQFSTPGTGAAPVFQFGTTTGVTFVNAAGQVTLTGSAADINAAMLSLQVRPGAHNDADITVTVTAIAVESNPAEANSTGPGNAGTEISVPTAQTVASFVIPVAAIADVPTLTGSGSGLEDQNIPVSITVGHPDNADGTEKIKNVVISGVPAGFTLSESSPGLGVLTANGGGTYTVTGPDDAAINGVLANLSLVFAPGGARQHLDTDFSLSVTATTIESAPSETGVGQVAQLETSQTFSVPVTVTAVVDGVTKSGASVIVEDVAKTIGTDIQWTKIDADGSEHVTSVVISAIPAGAVVTYTDLLGAVQTFTSTGVETITLTGPHSAATETAIRAALDTLAVTAPANTDTNFTLNVVITTTDNDASATTQSFTQTVVVQAVADAPTVAADAITLNEDTTATLAIRPDRSIDNDNSETLSVRITVPSDGTGVVGTLSAGAAAGITFTNVGGGVYTVAASGATPALREATLDAFLNGGVTFTPRPQWSGVLTGTNGIKVEAISTEAATLYGNTTPSPDDELAPNNNATAGTSGDLDTKIEIATTYIDVTVAAINDTPVLANASSIYQENTNSSAIADPDLVIPLGTRLGLSIADTDGSQGLSMTLTGLPTNAQALAFGTSLAGVTTSVDIPTGTVTISGTNANNVLTVLASLSITLADDRDQNFTVAINGTSTDTNGVTPVNTAFSLSHQVTVQAVADTPTVDVGATTKAAVDEDSGFVTYPVTTALNDTDGSETYQSVLVQFSTPGTGAAPVFQFGTTTGVTFVNAAGQVTLTGSAADINAAMLSLQVRPGADNGEDITVTVTSIAVESNPAEANSTGPGVAGTEISVPTATTVASFVIPVNPVPETPSIVVPASANGAEDTTFALGAITVSAGSVDPDGSEQLYIEIDTASYPSGTTFLNGATVVGTEVTAGWLRIPQSALATLNISPPSNYSGTINLSVRGVIVDTSTSGTITSVTAASPIAVTVTPDADGITPPTLSNGVEDNGAVAFGADLANATTGIRVVDNTSGTGNNSATETISKVVLDFPADTATQTYTVTAGAGVGSASVVFDAGLRTYTITSSLLSYTAADGSVSQADRAQAEADIRATLAGFSVTMGPTHTDLNGVIAVTATTLDVNGGLANSQDNTFNHTVRIQAVADTPTVSVVDPAVAVAEDGANIALTINAGNSSDTDNSETLSVRITVPSDGLGPIGTIVGTPPAGVTLTHQGGGVYLVTATGADNATREAALDSFLNGGGIAFDPRTNWGGELYGNNGIRVDVISTEGAVGVGVEVAANSFGGADNTSQTETVTDYIDVVVSPVPDAPTVKGNAVGVEDTRIPIPMSVTLADKDGSETYIVTITGGVPAGARIYGAGGLEILPVAGEYTLTPADVSALAIQPPLHYSSAVQGNITLVTVTAVTDASPGGSLAYYYTNNVVVSVTGVADVPGTRTVTVTADEDQAIGLGNAIVTSAGGSLNNLLVDTDTSEQLSFVVGGLPAGVIPTSAVAGVTYIGSGTWSVTAAAMPTLQLPAVPNFSGENPYSGVTVRAVTQEIDGDQATSAQWPVTIVVNPVINAGTVDGFSSWNLGATVTEATNENVASTGISLASTATHAFVDNDGSEAAVSYTFNLSNLIADAGIAARLASLPGAGSGLDKLVANYVSGVFTYNQAAGTITVLAANITGVELSRQLFLDSNRDFSIPVAALVRDTAIIGGSPVTVDKTENGTFNVNLVGTADVPSVFASSAAGNSGTAIPLTLGGASTDTDVALGRTLSESIFYVLRTTNPGTAPVFGLVDSSGNPIGIDTGGSFVLTQAEIADVRVITPGGVGGTISFELTTVATENDGDRATNSTTFDVVVTPQAGSGPGTAPLPPTVTVGANSGNEDGSITLNVTATPAPGDTTNPRVSVVISGLPSGAVVNGAILLPPVNPGDPPRWTASATDVANGLVTITPPTDFSGTMSVTVEGIARNANLQTATSGAQTVPVAVDPVADGVTISATPATGVEDTAVALNISLAEKDSDGNEEIGSFTYLTLGSGATLVGGYATVAGGDADAVVGGVSMVGYYRVPTADVGSLQMLPANNWHGAVTVTVAAYSVEPIDSTPDADNTKVDTRSFTVDVTADADAPTVSAPASFSGTEDTAIALPGLSAALVDTVTANGAEELSVTISGVPHGSKFSAGSNNGDGSWTIPVASLAALTFTPPPNYSGTATLTLNGIALELANGDEATSSDSFDVVVAPRADSVEILAANVTIDATARVALALNVRMADTTGTLPGENAAEQIRITFTSVPTGISLSAGGGGAITNPSAGTYQFVGTQEQANAIVALASSAATGGTYTISLSAVTIDGADTLATAVTDSFRLVVPQVVLGTGAAETLNGGSGTQLIYGLALNDTLNGGAGDDYLDGGTGADSMVGGTENDTYVVDNAGDIVVELASQGTDTITTTRTTLSLAAIANVENLTYTGAGNFTGTGNTLANTLTGGAGNDTLSGGAGDDRLDGRAGADSMVGGTENDTYVVDNVGDIVVELASQGTDTIETTLASYSLAAIANVENLTFTGSGNFTGTGNTLANILVGGAGNDTLRGGAGSDTLTGGSGADTYAWSSGELGTGVDAIVGFTAGGAGDKLDIAALLSGYTAGVSAISDFVRVTNAGADTTVEVDPNGGADSFQTLATLQGVNGLNVNTLLANGNLIV